MKALHFGAGNIGRGFVGKTILDSGFNLIFSDINKNLIDIINHYQEYNIKLVGNNYEEIITVKNVSAVHSYDSNIANLISNADLITTSVGVSSLDEISKILARGIILKIYSQNNKPLNIIACENKMMASSYLKKKVLEKISSIYYPYFKKYIGFVNCSIDVIIPTSFSIGKNKLCLVSENFKEWIVDSTQFKGEPPKIINMTLSSNLKYFIDRKFLTLNTGHAIAAYLGWTKKYKTIYETILDREIFQIVKNSMQESGLTLIKCYNVDENKHLSYINKILARFKNPYLLDKIERIARNPLQKLKKDERLIYPLLKAIKYNLPYSNLVKGISAAFFYKNKNDIESIKIFSLIKKYGIEQTIIKICDLNLNTKEVYSIILEYIFLLKKYSHGFLK